MPLPRISEYTAVTAELLCIYRAERPYGAVRYAAPCD